MQPYFKLAVCGVLFCLGLMNRLMPQYVIAAKSWWWRFQEDNFDQPDLEQMVDNALGRRRRRDMTAMGYRVTGGLLIIAAIVIWFIAS